MLYYLYSLFAGLLFLLKEILLLCGVLSVPVINYLIWGSALKPNLKLMYISIFALMMLGIMMIAEIKRTEPVDDLQRKFDPYLTFYERDLLKPSHITLNQAAPLDMGLDTCIDPEGNLVDLKKRLKYDNHWVLLEIPAEFLRKETIHTVLERGEFRSNALESSATEIRRDRFNQIKLEDFKFMDLYLKKHKLKSSTTVNNGVLFFDLDGANEESFEKYMRTVDEYQKSSLKGTNVLFTTSDNYMTNRIKGTIHFDPRVHSLQKPPNNPLLRTKQANSRLFCQADISQIRHQGILRLRIAGTSVCRKA
jgi:hypothetical protein